MRAPAGRLRLLRQRGDELIPDRYVRRSLASWYGDAFDGKPTASGEAFDSNLSVSNSLSGRHWELDQVPAVGDPTDIVQLGSGATQRCLNLGFSERIGNSRRTG